MTPRPAGLTAVPLPMEPVSHWLARASQDALPYDESIQGPSGFTTRALAADQRAGGEARRFTGATLSGWGLSALIDNAALVVTELLSNALRHGLATSPPHSSLPRPIWLGFLRRGSIVVCTVCDHSSRVPVLREPDPLAESGRGLHLVNCLSRSWGWTTPTAAGKAVWAVLSASDDDHTAHRETS